MKTRPYLALALCILFLIVTYLVFERLTGQTLTTATYHWGALRILPCFALGCAVNLVYRRAPVPRPRLLAALAFVLVTLSASALAWDGLTVACSALLILALASIPAQDWSILGSRPAFFLGQISYALYMVCAPWQMLAINLAAHASGSNNKSLPLVWWLGVMGGLITVAALTYLLIERPARYRVRRWAGLRP